MECRETGRIQAKKKLRNRIMIIGGIRKISLIDYPGEIASVVFTCGCNFRCIYCHNSHLVLPDDYMNNFAYEDIFSHLKKNTGKISAVVISGGEPTLNADLPDFVRNVKRVNFLVKIDTNGTNPEMLEELINEKLVDYIAMDIKSSEEKYPVITGKQFLYGKIKESISIIKSADVKKEFRTTVLKSIHTPDEIRAIKKLAGKVPLKFNCYRYTDSILDPSLGKGDELSEIELHNLIAQSG
jgi:pyruvate formate lyase activating enzyme